MSKVSDRIAKYWFGRGISDFMISATDFTSEDQFLIDAGVFKLSDEEITQLRPPCGCGHFEPILTLPHYDGKGDGRYVICSECGEEFEVPPREYQLYAFDPMAALPHAKTVRNMNEKAAIDESLKTVLIREPDGTLDDTKRFMRELSILVLTNHGKRFNLRTLLQSVLWIFSKHQPTDPFYNECVIAEKLRVGGRKPKPLMSMYHYARQGTITDVTVLKLIAREQSKLKLKLRQEELADLARIDPSTIT